METIMLPANQSLCDQYLHKRTMAQTILHRNQQATGDTAFKCRTTPKMPLVKFQAEIARQLDHLCSLRFQWPN